MKTDLILFDLDGTLLDTVFDLTAALNQLRKRRGLSPLDAAMIRPYVSLGSKAMLKCALNIDETDPAFLDLKQHFFDIYENNIAQHTLLFPKIDQVLSTIETHKIPWGIVTNKLSRHCIKLLTTLQLISRAACVIAGDSLTTSKPSPAPLLHACHLLKKDPAQCVYIGDAQNDVIASKAAGTRSLVALYGYIGPKENPKDWQADGYIKTPLEILNWLTF